MKNLWFVENIKGVVVTWVEVVVVRRVKAWIQLLRLKIGDDGEEAAFMVVMLVVAMAMMVMMIVLWEFLSTMLKTIAKS